MIITFGGVEVTFGGQSVEFGPPGAVPASTFKTPAEASGDQLARDSDDDQPA